MKRVDVYVELDKTVPAETERKFGYIMQYRETTRETFGRISGTFHGCILKICTAAIERMRENCEIHIHIPDPYVENMLRNNLKKWEVTDFKSAKGKPIANAEEWKNMSRLRKQHLIIPDSGEHEYSEWIRAELRREGN